jgi:aspartyl-tRNA(Asn)/glutamyl-tRNA(Gln) amidotransferase subunit A
MTAPHEWTIKETLTALESQQISATELFDLFIQRIHRYNAELGAFITVCENERHKALAVDERRRRGERLGPLAGVPIAMKDLIDTHGIRTTYGGLHYRDHVPTKSATVVKKLEDAGAIIIGKANLHEYAYGTTNENPHYGHARNPWAPDKVSGGSSGGSSVAIVAGLATAAVGTDTGGSIRIPSALTGHVGLKPTYGLVSRAGVFPLAPSLDHVGPMTKSVEDAAILLNVMSGFDPQDEGSRRIPVSSYISHNLTQQIRIGVPQNFFFELCHPDVKAVVHKALETLEQNGFTLVECKVDDIEEVPEMQRIVITSEAFAVHRTLYAASPEQYGEDVRNRLTASKETLGHEYVSALEFRKRFQEKMAKQFTDIDVLLTPTTPLPAVDIGTWTTVIDGQEVQVRGHLTRYTNPWNFSGLPALSVPCGLTKDHLPVGLQLVGSAYSERKLLAIGKKIESCLSWRTVAPQFR